MPVSSHDVAAVLRERIPGLPIKKLHKLLYYCQGHHLSNTGEPLFADTISAWDMGPVVGRLWFQERRGERPPTHATLAEGQLNTIGYVVSRYGRLTGGDLRSLTHAEMPWQQANRARSSGESAPIREAWMRDWFTRPDQDEDDESGLLDAADVAAWLKGASERKSDNQQPDDIASLRARLSSAS